MKYLIDTDVCIAFLKGAERSLMREFHSRRPTDLVLCSVVKAELIYGAQKSQKPPENLNLLKEFFQRFVSLPFDDKAAAYYGIARMLLEKKGMPIGANDLLIASIAQANELTLVSRNEREFSRVPHLNIEAW